MVLWEIVGGTVGLDLQLISAATACGQQVTICMVNFQGGPVHEFAAFWPYG